ncbi:5-oxoprolinase subunit PxpB [bacterium]|nr:MAG: 5-oxoprolinase subunit PxpB [bacterium]
MEKPWQDEFAVGDAALLLQFGERVDAAVNERVHRVARAADALLGCGELPGVWGVIPSYTTLLIEFDPLTIERGEILVRLRRGLARSESEVLPARRFRVPVWYAGEDLAAVAERTGLSVERVVELHTSLDFRIFTVGFTPGQPLCGILPEPLRLPRRGAPRAAVPPGSVAIAGQQVTVYPTASPGGWHLLGLTPAIPFRAQRQPPVLWAPGDLLRFYAVDQAHFERLQAASARGEEWLCASA